MNGPIRPRSPEMRKAVGQMKACLKNAGIGDGALLMVACSGGRDSLALALTAKICSREMGFDLGAVVVDHGLQMGSREVAQGALSKLAGMGIGNRKLASVEVDPDEAKLNGVEAAARAARYGAVVETCKACNAAAALLAHTRTDQAENVLLDICKTPSSSSWKGMGAQAHREGILFLRPFLNVSRKETTRICLKAGIKWWDDPTNGEIGGYGGSLPRRSRIRTELLPVLDEVSGGSAEAHLAAFASMHREDEEFLDGLAVEVISKFNLSLPCSIPAEELSSLPRALERRCCRMILKRFLDKRGAVEKQVEAFLNLLDKKKGSISLPSSLELSYKRGGVLINLCNN